MVKHEHLQTVSNSVRNSPETKHLKIWDLILRDRIHGKQKRNCFGGGPRRSLRSRRRLRPLLLSSEEVSSSTELCDPCRRRSRRRLLPSSARAASCASSGSEKCAPPPPGPRVLCARAAAGTAGTGSVTAVTPVGKRVRDGEMGLPVQSVCCCCCCEEVAGRDDGGPLDPCVQVRTRCGRFSLVDGRSGTPRAGKRGVLGESGSGSPE